MKTTTNPNVTAESHRDGVRVQEIGARRMRVSFLLTALLLVLYLGFMILVAFAKSLLDIQVVQGLTVAIIMGITVIVGAWLLALAYVLWANKHHDPACDELSNRGGL